MLQHPTTDEVEEIARGLKLELNKDELETFRGLMRASIDACNDVDAMEDDLPPVKYPREGGYRPDSEENPLNGWYWRTKVTGAPGGPLGPPGTSSYHVVMLLPAPIP